MGVLDSAAQVVRQNAIMRQIAANDFALGHTLSTLGSEGLQQSIEDIEDHIALCVKVGPEIEDADKRRFVEASMSFWGAYLQSKTDQQQEIPILPPYEASSNDTQTP